VGRSVKGVFISPADRSPIFVTLSPGSGFLVNILASPHDTVRRTEDLLGAWNRDSNRNKPLEGIVAEVPVLGSTPQRPLLPWQYRLAFRLSLAISWRFGMCSCDWA